MFSATRPELAILWAIGALIYLWFAWKVATQARNRGYSTGIWLLMSFVTFNPILVLILLTMLPDRRRINLREQWRGELDLRLATAAPMLAGHAAGSLSIPARSLGDQERPLIALARR